MTIDYTKALTEDPVEGFVFFEESIELSRRFRAVKLWMSMQFHGHRAFRAAISRNLEHAQILVEAIKARPDLELLASAAEYCLLPTSDEGQRRDLAARHRAWTRLHFK